MCLGEKDVKYILLNCWETRSFWITFLNQKLLNVNKEVAYRKIIRCANKYQIINLREYLDNVR